MKHDFKKLTRAQPPPKNATVKAKIVEKLESARERLYLEKGSVSSLISFFEVIKALVDIRLVYDGTKSGPNEAMWAPWFGLPTIESLLQCLGPGTFQGRQRRARDVFKLCLTSFNERIVWRRPDSLFRPGRGEKDHLGTLVKVRHGTQVFAL